MNDFVWRTVSAGKYVCSYTGSDTTGDGLPANPFKSLTKAYNSAHVLTVAVSAAGTGYTAGDILTLATPSGGIAARVTVTAINAGTGAVTAVTLLYRGVGYTTGIKATTGGTGTSCTINVATVSAQTGPSGDIICRGLFSDNLTGAQTANINGDYYGAAVWDGQSLYSIYGFRHNNMIFINSAVSTLYVGVGGAPANSNVGKVDLAYGLAGSPAFVDNCCLYWGVIGGISINFAVYSRIKPNANYLVSLGSYCGAITWSENLTIYGTGKTSMRKAITTGPGKGFYYRYSLLSAMAIYLDQAGTFDRCMFAGDCTFWIGDTEFTPTGVTDADKLASIVTALAGLPGVAGTDKVVITSTGDTQCRYTSQTAADLFNNVTVQDYTLKPAGDAVLSTTDPLYVPGVFTYFGAMKPSLNVPILADSSGVVGSWDERTATGVLSVPADNIMQLDISDTEGLSEIMTKVITINNQLIVMDGIKALMIPKMNDRYYMEDRAMVSDTPIYKETELAVGRYIVRGASLTYGGATYNIGDIVYVSATGTSFSAADMVPYLLAVSDPNIWNCIHVRATNVIYATVAVGGALQDGGIYLNYGNENITYQTRTIVPGESFMAVGSADSFTGSAGYLIGIVFDDTRVPAAKWIPALCFDDYFNGIYGTQQVVDDDGRPASCGNPKAWVEPLKSSYTKELLNRTYFQLKVMLRRYDTV